MRKICFASRVRSILFEESSEQGINWADFRLKIHSTSLFASVVNLPVLLQLIYCISRSLDKLLPRKLRQLIVYCRNRR